MSLGFIYILRIINIDRDCNSFDIIFQKFTFPLEICKLNNKYFIFAYEREIKILRNSKLCNQSKKRNK